LHLSKEKNNKMKTKTEKRTKEERIKKKRKEIIENLSDSSPWW
jgi:hypothetical protein